LVVSPPFLYVNLTKTKKAYQMHEICCARVELFRGVCW
jgi:hypothetical protein